VPVTVSDHGALTGLGDDDHPQYLKAALVDAKGDLLVGTGADALGRLVVGSNGRILSADSAQATGLAWVDPPATLANPMTTPGDLIAAGAGGAPTRLAIGTAGQALTVAGGVPTWAARYGALAFTLGDGVNAIAATEPAQWIEVPFGATITQATLTADAAGSVVVDVQVAAYASYPPTSAQTICGAAKPTLASAIKSQDATLAGWTTALARGSYVRVVVVSASVVKRVLLSLGVTGV
jgi:hypothetical protein